MKPKRRIAIATSTRADWGLLSPVACRLRDSGVVDVAIIATNMHLDPARGMTVTEIEDDGFSDIYRVPVHHLSDSAVDTAVAMSECLGGMASTLGELRPDMLLLLGDRYEMLAVASAATLLGIPIAHIAGGEISEGAIDDNIRHAITKLSSLHFATTDEHRRRIIAMGESPENVYNTGAIGVCNLLGGEVIPKHELEKSLGIDIDRSTLLVTYHPATNDPVDPAIRFRALLDALDRFPDSNVVITYPNNDPRSAAIMEMTEQYASHNPHRVRAVKSLGRVRYLSMLHYVGAVVGNSSSGIVEVPSAHIPTVDIGIRQRGRCAGCSVIHCDDDTESISEAIAYALSAEGVELAREASNPYYKENTVETIVEALLGCDCHALLPKHFHDVNT